MFSLIDMLHGLRVATNLIYVHTLYHDNKVSIEFSLVGFCVEDLPSKRVKFQGLSKHGLYQVHGSTGGSLSSESVSSLIMFSTS